MFALVRSTGLNGTGVVFPQNIAAFPYVAQIYSVSDGQFSFRHIYEPCDHFHSELDLLIM